MSDAFPSLIEQLDRDADTSSHDKNNQQHDNLKNGTEIRLQPFGQRSKVFLDQE